MWLRWATTKRLTGLRPDAAYPPVSGNSRTPITGASVNLLAEVLAESGDCEVHFAVACGLDQARSNEPVPVLGHDVGLGRTARN